MQFDLACRDRQAQVAADIEEIVLHAVDQLGQLFVALRLRQENSQECIELINRAVRRHAWMVFRHSAAVAETGVAEVARFGVDA